MSFLKSCKCICWNGYQRNSENNECVIIDQCQTMNCPSGKVCTMTNGPRCVDAVFECEGLLEFWTLKVKYHIWIVA